MRLKKSANGEEGQEDFEDCATRGVLVGGLVVESDDMLPSYPVKNGLCLYENRTVHRNRQLIFTAVFRTMGYIDFFSTEAEIRESP